MPHLAGHATPLVKVHEQLTASEIRFQQRCISEVQFDYPSTSTITDNISLPRGSDSEVSSTGSVSCYEFYEPSAKKQKLDSAQNRGQYFYLAQYGERYNIPHRAVAALATSVLMDHGIIEPNDINKKFVID